MSTYKKTDDTIFYIGKNGCQTALRDRKGNDIYMGLNDISNNFNGNLLEPEDNYILISDTQNCNAKIVSIDSTKTAGTIVITCDALPNNINNRIIIYKYNDIILFKIKQQNIEHCFIYGVYNYNNDAGNGGISYITLYGNLFIFYGTPASNTTAADYKSLISVPAIRYSNKILYTFCIYGNALNLAPNTWNPMTFNLCKTLYNLKHEEFTCFEDMSYYDFNNYYVMNLSYINNVGRPGDVIDIIDSEIYPNDFNIYIYRNDLREWYKVGYLSFNKVDANTNYAYFGGYYENN